MRLLPRPAQAVDLDEAYAVPPSPERHVRAIMVASVDGAAVVDGGSAELSGPADRRVLSVLRGLADVVLVGAATVRAEDLGPARPSLERRERRLAAGMGPAPPIAVVSGRLDLDPGSRCFTAAGERRPLVLTTESAPRERRTALEQVADVLVVGESTVDPRAAVSALGDRGLHRVLCEGGPSLLGQLHAAGCLDELCLTVSPRLNGGEGTPILAGPPPPGHSELELRHVLEQDGFLFLRYAVGPRRT